MGVSSEEQEPIADGGEETKPAEDHWGGLASELGAEAQPVAQGHEEPQAVDDLPVAFDAVPSTSKMSDTVAGDWGGLAESLGRRRRTD